MVEISKSGSGEGPGWETGWGYSTVEEVLGLPTRATAFAAGRSRGYSRTAS